MSMKNKQDKGEGLSIPTPKNYFPAIFWGPRDDNQFLAGIQKCIDQLNSTGIFATDNLITFGRQLGFLNDEHFMKAFNSNVQTDIERAIIWRSHILSWAAESCLRRVSTAEQKGTTVAA